MADRDWRVGLLILLFACLATALAPVRLLIEPIGAPLRQLLLPAAAILGLLLAGPAGLRIAPRNARQGLLLPLLAGLAVALPILLLDLGSIGSSSYASLPARLTYFPLRSLNEELIYRLGAMTLIAWLLLRSRLLRGRSGRAAALVLAAALAQALNCLINIPTAQLEAEPAYILVRYFAPGLLWGLLYWRLGFAAAAAGHVAGHLWLQPAATLLGGWAISS